MQHVRQKRVLTFGTQGTAEAGIGFWPELIYGKESQGLVCPFPHSGPVGVTTIYSGGQMMFFNRD
ncbi:hypothetical protein M9991_12410 [Chryseobacterium gallinarum]|uniref:hypothetical protein n=1 Tax=Chryseobacterium gallinarum TaxID=1324352 RepID=UPI00202466F3|nr:hypothetical protein [Chryseobacterium gallinarum]MCL8537667.1 hypothetical protein [Chryseobacterium gallinarum]